MKGKRKGKVEVEEEGNKGRRDIRKRSSRRGSRGKKLGKVGKRWKGRMVKEKGRERKIGKGMLEISKRKTKQNRKTDKGIGE